jgi:hypothetical protein
LPLFAFHFGHPYGRRTAEQAEGKRYGMDRSSERRAARWEQQRESATAKQLKRTARRLQRARVADGPAGGGTLLTEHVIVLEGEHRGVYELRARNAVLIGTAGPMDPSAPHRERVEIHAAKAGAEFDEFGFARHPGKPAAVVPDALVVSLLIAERFGSLDDVVLDAHGSELVRLENPWRSAGTDELGQPARSDRASRRRSDPDLPIRWIQCLGLAPRRIVASGTPTGWVTAGHHSLRNTRRLVLDAAGGTAAVVTRTGGHTTTKTRSYVVDVRQSVDLSLRVTALVVGFLWDWYTIAWEAGG